MAAIYVSGEPRNHCIGWPCARLRGEGIGLYRPTYRDKVTKEIRDCAIWYARYQLHGRKVVESTGTTKYEEARQWLRRREGAAAAMFH